MKKSILIIGGGSWQVPIIQKAKELGHTIINTNLYKNSPGFEFADFSYVVDVLDKEKNLEIAKTHHVDAVITDQSDIAVNTVAYINEKLHLKGATIDIAELFTNKYRMRQELKVDHLHHPKFKLCKSLEELQSFFYEINSEIIIKPTNNQSSRGVRLISNEDEIETAFKYTQQFCKDKNILVEEFIGGIELTVEGFKYPKGKHYTFSISKKSYFNNKIGIANSLIYLPEHKEFDRKTLEQINNQLFTTLNFGITHVEYKFYDGKFYLIEAAIRGGGTKISSHIVPVVSGYNINELLIKSALCENVHYTQDDYKQCCCALKFFDFGSGIVKHIEAKLQKYESNIIDFKLEFSIGDKLSSPLDDRSRVGYTIVQARSENELNALMNNIEKNIFIEFE